MITEDIEEPPKFQDGWYLSPAHERYYATRTRPRRERKSKFVAEKNMVFCYSLRLDPKTQQPDFMYVGYMDWEEYGCRYLRIEGPTL